MYPTVIMQDVEHLLDSVLASAMLPNSEFVTDVRHLLLRRPRRREPLFARDGDATQQGAFGAHQADQGREPHDRVALAGSKVARKKALAFYAVKTAADANNPLDVVTLDAAHQQLARSAFWEMNKIESHVETKEVTDIVLEEDDEGNRVEVEKTVTERILYIELSHTTRQRAPTASMPSRPTCFTNCSRKRTTSFGSRCSTASGEAAATWWRSRHPRSATWAASPTSRGTASTGASNGAPAS